VQHDDGAESIGGTDRCNGDSKKVLAQRTGDDFGFNARLAFDNGANGFEKLGLPDDFD